MSRGLTSGEITSVTANPIHYAYLVEMDFVDSPVRFWSGNGTLSYDGKSWQGVGALGSIQPLEETKGSVAKRIELSLVGQGTGLYSAAMADSRQMQGQSVTITGAWMDEISTSGTVLFAYELKKAIMDTMRVEDVIGVGETNGIRITITAVDELVDMGRPSTVYYSDANQKKLYPGDTFFRFINTLPGKDIKWALAAAGVRSGGKGNPLNMANRRPGRINVP